MMRRSEIRWMKRHVCAGALVTGLLFPLATEAASKENITIPFTLTNPQQTCKLTFDNGGNTMNYQLGVMNKGVRMQHRPFTVKVGCGQSTVVKTALTARNTTGTLQGGGDSSVVIMRMNGQPSNNGPLFWLENGSKRVKLTGKDDDAFCISPSPNNCELRPVTDIPANSPEGNIDVTVVFDVVYPQ
ncbi:hypothetical protein YD21_15345 [Salmonella enterica subsp. enterica serovar Typhimurium]|nr:hypothetical protein [Salmonella enterica subsp. enterica serovar Typhimurium]